MPHLLFTLFAALLLSVAMSMLDHREFRERIYVAARMFFCCVAAFVGGGWLMRFIHG